MANSGSRAGWRATCPMHVTRLLQRLERDTPCTIVTVVEPTCFVLRCQGNRKLVTVTLGDRHKCTAGCAQQPCLHVLCVLTSHFGLTRQSSTLWQDGMREVELAQLSDQHYSTSAKVCRFCKETVDKQIIHICSQCGATFHLICCRLAARLHSSGTPRCPQCTATLSDTSAQRCTVPVLPNKCSACRVACPSHRCMLCDHYVLCSACHRHSIVHTHHPFRSISTGTHRCSVHDAEDRRRSEGVQREHIDELLYREIEPEDYETLLSLEQPVRHTLSDACFAQLMRCEFDSARHNSQCPVCLEDFTEGQLHVELICHHLLHESCARRWLTRHCAKCPVDHTPITTT